MKLLYYIAFFQLYLCLTSCAGGGSSGRGEIGQGSEPINKIEEVKYKQALIRCHKTGGTRIVKIAGKLRCF